MEFGAEIYDFVEQVGPGGGRSYSQSGSGGGGGGTGMEFGAEIYEAVTGENQSSVLPTKSACTVTEKG